MQNAEHCTQTQDGSEARALPTPALTAVRSFNRDLGIVPSTFWRWRKRGWVGDPINIGGRLYLTHEQIQEFRARASRGEFATSLKPPTPVRRVV